MLVHTWMRMFESRFFSGRQWLVGSVHPRVALRCIVCDGHVCVTCLAVAGWMAARDAGLSQCVVMELQCCCVLVEWHGLVICMLTSARLKCCGLSYWTGVLVCARRR